MTGEENIFLGAQRAPLNFEPVAEGVDGQEMARFRGSLFDFFLRFTINWSRVRVVPK
jgi:hypothetical protein